VPMPGMPRAASMLGLAAPQSLFPPLPQLQSPLAAGGPALDPSNSSLPSPADGSGAPPGCSVLFNRPQPTLDLGSLLLKRQRAAATLDSIAQEAIGRAIALARRCTIVEPKSRRLFHQDASAIVALPLHPRQDTERGQSIRSLEQFWDQYRAGGSLESERPTNADYGEAVRRALIASGVSPEQASDLVGQAAAQRAAYGLSDSAAVPHIPPPIWRRRRN
jgi:hypothetical protein